MQKLINILSGIILGMLPVAGAILIGILIYAAIPTILGIIILCVLSALASWIGIKIFKTVQIVGPIDFMTAVHATPELDKKSTKPDSNTKSK